MNFLQECPVYCGPLSIIISFGRQMEIALHFLCHCMAAYWSGHFINQWIFWNQGRFCLNVKQIRRQVLPWLCRCFVWNEWFFSHRYCRTCPFFSMSVFIFVQYTLSRGQPACFFDTLLGLYVVVLECR